MTNTARHRRVKNLDAGPFHPVINSFALHLRAEGKAPKTVRTYTEAAAWFAAEHLRRRTDHADWDQVQRSDIEAWLGDPFAQVDHGGDLLVRLAGDEASGGKFALAGRTSPPPGAMLRLRAMPPHPASVARMVHLREDALPFTVFLPLVHRGAVLTGPGTLRPAC